MISRLLRRPKYVHGRPLRKWRRIEVAVEVVVILALLCIPWQIAISNGYRIVKGGVTGEEQASTAVPEEVSTVDEVSSGGNKAKTNPQTPAGAVTSPQTGASLGYGIAAGGGLTYIGTPELNTYFSGLKDLGVTWVRWDLDWGLIQPNNAATYNWLVADRVVAAANKYDISSLVIIDYTPKWARDSACANDGGACKPANPAAFATFASEAAKRYKNQGVHYWEIWNEPNDKNFWLPQPSAADYTALLKPTYTAIKSVDPMATVLSGGLSAVGDDSGNTAPITFVKNMYASGAGRYLDAVAAHPYTYPSLPSYIAWWNRWQQLVPIHDFMTQQGDGTKKVWITEVGAPTGGSGVAHTPGDDVEFVYGEDYMTEQAQATIMTDALNLYKQYSAWAGPFFWYSFRDDGQSPVSPEAFFGLLRSDGSHKPAYDVYKQAIH